MDQLKFLSSTVFGVKDDFMECIYDHFKSFVHEVVDAAKSFAHGDRDGAIKHLEKAQEILESIEKDCKP